MITRFLQPLSLGLSMMLCAAAAAAADLESAKRAYEQKDYAAAASAFTELAEQGNEEAQVSIARMYMLGEGVQKDRTQAEKWFKSAAARGNADAQFFLGSMYLLPQIDVAEGLKWLRLSADQGMQDAQYLLGKAYMQGATTLSRDAVQGYMWLRLAADGNQAFYQNEMQAAKAQLSADEIAKADALVAAWKPKRRTQTADR
jgi:TPR repeat protein